MQDLTTAIREEGRRLLREGEVEVVTGFEQGTLPLRTTPCFIREEKDADRLVWNSNCENNLALYLPKRKEKTGVITKGCDARSIITLIKENQVAREQVVIIGVPCPGVIDREKVQSRLRGEEVLEAEEKEEEITIKGYDFQEVIRKRFSMIPAEFAGTGTP